MTSYRSKTCLVYDHGQFVELARRLAKDFGRVLYYSPWEAALPTSNDLRVGNGIRGIERVRDIWTDIDDIDLFVFPDVYEGALQVFLEQKMGKRVWGSRLAEDLELNRAGSKVHCVSCGVDIGPYEVVTGLDALRDHLKANDDVYVKISVTRGDMETFHAPNYAAVEQRLDGLAHTLGPMQKVTEFLVEEAIPDAIEVGYDGWTIDGKFPSTAIVGVEAKDRAYACTTMDYGNLPEAVRCVNDCLAPSLRKYGYRGFLSTEVRATKDGAAYLIDPCCRCGSPPSELYMTMVDNISDVIWEGAGGVMVEPKFNARFGAQLQLLSDWADDDWQQVKFPKSIRENVKLRNFTEIEGEYYVIPQGHGIIGAVVATGKTLDAAIAECKRLVEQVEGDSIEKPAESLDQAAEQLTDFLAEQKPKSKTAQKAAALAARGMISPKQLAKMNAD